MLKFMRGFCLTPLSSKRPLVSFMTTTPTPCAYIPSERRQNSEKGRGEGEMTIWWRNRLDAITAAAEAAAL